MIDLEKEKTVPAENTQEQPDTPAAAEPVTAAKAPKATMTAKAKRTLGTVIAAIAVVVLLVLAVADGARVQREKNEAEAEASKTAELAAENSATSEDVPTTEETVAIDYDAAYAKYAPDTVVLTVNGEEVTWDEYYCWIFSMLGQLANYYGISDWNTELDADYTVGDYVLEYAEGMGGQYHLIDAKAAELGLRLNADDEAEVDSLIENDAAAYYGGSIEDLQAYLDANYFSMDYYRFMVGSSLLYDKVYAYYYGSQGETLAAEDVVSFLTEHNYLHAKHILLSNTDDSSTALDDAALAEKKALAETLLAELQAVPSEELDAKFDEYVAQYSEDPGSLTYFDGYYFQSGEMATEFEDAILALADGELSGIVESSYGYHIIYRPAMDPEDLFDYDDSGMPLTVRKAAANGLFNNMIADWSNEMEIVYMPEFEGLTLDALFRGEN